MRKILFLLIFLLAVQYNYSQNTYTINDQQLELKTEIDGKLDLLWNTFNGQYRYFVRTEDGQRLDVLFPGYLNRDSGPDFKEAKVRIGDVLFVDNVELRPNT